MSNDILKNILENLLQHPPVEGSIASHEAWKENVWLVLHMITFMSLETRKEFLAELSKTGYISKQCKNEANLHLEKILLPLKRV